MTSTDTKIPAALAEIMQEFKAADDREKLELLLEFSDGLPDLPQRLEHMLDEMTQVEECQAPVSIHAESEDGQLRYFFAIPESAPTVRGFAGIMLEGTEGATPEEIIQIPSDFFVEMGLAKVLSPQRLHGMAGVLAHMKRMAVASLDGQTS